MTEHDPDPATDDSGGRRPVVLGPGEGRAYRMGRLDAIFKVDDDAEHHLARWL